MNIKCLAAVSALAIGLVSSGAWAQSVPSTTFDVTITIQSTCNIAAQAADDVDFGAHPSTATDIEADGMLYVSCTELTPYNIQLNEGLLGTSVSDRAMAGPEGAEVPYQLYRDAARTQVWGQTIGTDTLSSVGTGDVQNHPVHGLVPSANFPAGDYVDTVTATVVW